MNVKYSKELFSLIYEYEIRGLESLLFEIQLID